MAITFQKYIYAADIYNTKGPVFIQSYDPSTSTATFENRTILDELTIKSDHDLNPVLRFQDCTFEGNVILWGTEFSKDLLFFNCIFEKNIFVRKGYFPKNLIFEEGEVKGGLKIDNGKFEHISISLKCNIIAINHGSFKKLLLWGTYDKNQFMVNYLTINFSYVTGTLNVMDLKIKKTKLFGIVEKDTELTIKGVSYQALLFNDLYNSGKLRLIDLTALQIIEERQSFFITKSNLGKTEFFNLDLRLVDTIVINSSFLIECTFVNISWPKDLSISSHVSDSNNLLDLKEMYRQLKYAYWKQGDTVLEHKFHGLEMNAYRKYLREVRKEASHVSFFERWLIKRQNSLILWFSWRTSDYGQNFVWPLVTLYVSGIVLFTWLVGMDVIPGYYISARPDLINTLSTYSAILEFVNPLHKYEPGLKGGAYTIDMIMRIVSSYCLYNIIRATRRFVK